MGQCVSRCMHPGEKQTEGEDPPTNGHDRGKQRRRDEQPSQGGGSDNVPLNSFLQRDTSMQRRTMSRQFSRTTSIVSWKSARSHLDGEDASHDGDYRSLDGDSLDLNRWASGAGSSDRHLSGGSPGSGTPPDSPNVSGSLDPQTLRKAWESKNHGSKRRSRPSRPSSLAGAFSLSRRTSMAAEPAAGDYEAETSPGHADPAAFDRALLAATNAIFGHEAKALEDVPLLPVAPWNRKPGYLGHLTGDQEKTLEAFRTSFPGCERFHTTHDLLRFLRARSFDLKATRTMYRKYIDVYRERMMISPAPLTRDVFGNWPLHHVGLFPPRPEAVTEMFKKALRCFLHIMVFGQDKGGRPVVYMRVTDVVKHSMTQYVPLVERLALQASANEANRLLCIMASAKFGYQIEEITQIMDVAKVPIFSMISHIRSKENQAEFQYNSDYVPETLGKVIIVNAPFGAGNVWKLAQVFIPPSTREKISICTTEYKSTLLEHIDADQLPSCYGGTAQHEWPEHEKPKRVY